MKVEIWSDVVCPFCYIGKQRFENALQQFPNPEKVEVIYKSFELDPYSKKDQHSDLHGALAQKFGMSYEKAKEMNANMTRQAKEVGLTYNLDTAIPTNTFDAHRLMHFAKSKGKMKEVAERLFEAYFTHYEHIGDRGTLAKIAEETGLNRDEAAKMLESDDFTKEVRLDEQEAQQLGVQGVPFFVINRKYAVSGAQPVEVFINALNKAWSEEQPLTVLNDDSNGTCTDGSCSI
jgi:predicted DsbA family dithiol-disulfide isomerase